MVYMVQDGDKEEMMIIRVTMTMCVFLLQTTVINIKAYPFVHWVVLCLTCLTHAKLNKSFIFNLKAAD